MLWHVHWIEPARNRMECNASAIMVQNIEFLDQVHNYVQPEEGPGPVVTLLLYSVHTTEFLICLYELLHTD
jgi:hypothetical protein